MLSENSLLLPISTRAPSEVSSVVPNSPISRTVPVIVVSGETDPAVRHRVLTQGALCFLTKPYEIGDLLRLVDDSLGAGRR